MSWFELEEDLQSDQSEDLGSQLNHRDHVHHLLAPTMKTSISANANGPHDADSCKIDHIALPILYRFPVIARFSSKVANFTQPHLYLSPP